MLTPTTEVCPRKTVVGSRVDLDLLYELISLYIVMNIHKSPGQMPYIPLAHSHILRCSQNMPLLQWTPCEAISERHFQHRKANRVCIHVPFLPLPD